MLLKWQLPDALSSSTSIKPSNEAAGRHGAFWVPTRCDPKHRREARVPIGAVLTQ